MIRDIHETDILIINGSNAVNYNKLYRALHRLYELLYKTYLYFDISLSPIFDTNEYPIIDINLSLYFDKRSLINGIFKRANRMATR